MVDKGAYPRMVVRFYVLVSKETYNRPKETYSYAKRDLQIYCHTWRNRCDQRPGVWRGWRMCVCVCVYVCVCVCVCGLCLCINTHIWSICMETQATHTYATHTHTHMEYPVCGLCLCMNTHICSICSIITHIWSICLETHATHTHRVSWHQVWMPHSGMPVICRSLLAYEVVSFGLL